MQIRPVCPVYVVEREIAQVEHEDFLGGSFAVVRSRKIILEGSGKALPADARLPVYPSIYPFLFSLSFFPSLSSSLFRSIPLSTRFVSFRFVSFCPVPSRFVFSVRKRIKSYFIHLLNSFVVNFRLTRIEFVFPR